MMADFPDHLGRQNEDEARFRHRKLGFPQSGTTAAQARPIRRSHGYFDRRIDNLPEAQLRKAGARDKRSPMPCAGRARPEIGRRWGVDRSKDWIGDDSRSIRPSPPGSGNLPCPPRR
jgi:hypothetical protein